MGTWFSLLVSGFNLTKDAEMCRYGLHSALDSRNYGCTEEGCNVFRDLLSKKPLWRDQRGW